MREYLRFFINISYLFVFFTGVFSSGVLADNWGRLRHEYSRLGFSESKRIEFIERLPEPIFDEVDGAEYLRFLINLYLLELEPGPFLLLADLIERQASALKTIQLENPENAFGAREVERDNLLSLIWLFRLEAPTQAKLNTTLRLLRILELEKRPWKRIRDYLFDAWLERSAKNQWAETQFGSNFIGFIEEFLANNPTLQNIGQTRLMRLIRVLPNDLVPQGVPLETKVLNVRLLATQLGVPSKEESQAVTKALFRLLGHSQLAPFAVRYIHESLTRIGGKARVEVDRHTLANIFSNPPVLRMLLPYLHQFHGVSSHLKPSQLAFLLSEDSPLSISERGTLASVGQKFLTLPNRRRMLPVHADKKPTELKGPAPSVRTLPPRMPVWKKWLEEIESNKISQASLAKAVSGILDNAPFENEQVGGCLATILSISPRTTKSKPNVDSDADTFMLKLRILQHRRAAQFFSAQPLLLTALDLAVENHRALEDLVFIEASEHLESLWLSPADQASIKNPGQCRGKLSNE